MAHRLLIGKGMITLNLKRIFLALTLLPLFAVAADDCALSDPTLTVQAYTVNPQTERVKMYWQKANGEAWGTLHALLADMNSQGQVQMAMNGGIYDESYAPLGLYIENGQQKVALNLASGEGNFFIRPGGVFYVAGDKVGIVRLDAFKTSKEIQFAVQSGPMLLENGVINPRTHNYFPALQHCKSLHRNSYKAHNFYGKQACKCQIRRLPVHIQPALPR